jgi:hypothetical protein
MEQEKGNLSISDYKKQKRVGNGWLRTHAPFLFNWKSVFYFGVFLFALSIAWAANLLYENSGTSLLGWDYSWQFIPYAYDFYDQWHVFFSTGHFPLYDSTIWLGLDNIGSNSYYSLFDPFLVILIIFPRSWIPVLFAFSTFLKFMVAGLLMRWYLRYHGINEVTSRLGAIAYAFSGYMMFMYGFPTTVSACTYIPLILLGIDKVVRDQKPYCLISGLFLLGITSFFFLVVACIFGVCYALWRYFWSFKSRKAKDNVKVMIIGVLSFAIGMMMCAWTLLPSLRQTSLSGRSSSIGSAYLSAVISSLKSHDFKSFFMFIFEPVGDHPMRELMGLISFFFPSGGYLYLPLAQSGYDAWTASIFCYTPFIIFFFTGILISVKKQKWNHIIAILLCLFCVFTNFSYYFFYAFSGNGYGRWFIMLSPLIILYGCWAFDTARTEPSWVRFLGGAISLLCTLLAFFIIKETIKSESWEDGNPFSLTYWQSSYESLEEVKDSPNVLWYVYAQVGYIIVESVLFVAFNAKKWMPHALMGILCVEVIVAGNAASAAYYSIYNYENRFMGGSKNFDNSLKVASAIQSDGLAFARTQMDQTTGSGSEAKSFTTVLGLNSAAAFHSLMNFDTEDFALMNNMKFAGGTRTTYNETEIYNPNWSGYYGNKRFATDMALGYRYYAVKNDYSSWVSEMPANVPFGSEKIYSLPAEGKEDRSRYTVYRVSDDYAPTLGHAIDSSKLYRIGHVKDSYYKTSFYNSDSYNRARLRSLLRAEDAYLNGAIFEDDDEVPSSFSFSSVPGYSDEDISNDLGLTPLTWHSGLKAFTVDTGDKGGLFPKAGLTGSPSDTAYFLSSSYVRKSLTSANATATKDSTHVVFCSSSSDYLSDDETGCYIEMKYWTDDDNIPRVMVFGDVKQEDGTYKENQLLSFEYSSLYNAHQAGYCEWRSSTFGLYVNNGRAKYLCFCWPGSGNIKPKIYPDHLTLYVTSKQQIVEKQKELSKESLQDVKQENANEYSFSTDYSEDRIVVTQLGYDKGWSCKAYKEDGTSVDCKVYKLDGGLVGFIAPKGKNTYRLSYCTVYLKGGVALSCIGTASVFGFAIYSFLASAKRSKNSGEATGEDSVSA